MKKGTLVVKKADTLQKIWLGAQKSVDRARAKLEQLRLREEGECKALRLKCALSKDMKARIMGSGWL